MMFNTLEKIIYNKSRYEMVMLLQDVQQGKPQVPPDFQEFAVFANHCEHIINRDVPAVPYSEERLALFLHTYFNKGSIASSVQAAFSEHNRPLIWFALRYPVNPIADICHFYIADIVGLFDSCSAASDREIEFVLNSIDNLYLKNKKILHDLDRQLWFLRGLQAVYKKYPAGNFSSPH